MALAALAAAVLISGDSVRHYFSRRRELTRMETQAVESRRRVAALEARLAQAETDPSFIETAARRELGLIREGEIEFRFVEGHEEKVEVD